MKHEDMCKTPLAMRVLGFMTALQHVGKELGIVVIISPKFHAELAWEGIEYIWGITKALYWRKPLHSKRSKESFKRLVLECTSRQVLRTATVRKLSRRARAYICAYYALYESNNKGDIKRQALTLPLIERVVKEFKPPRTVIDFDVAFVNRFVPLLDKEFFSWKQSWSVRTMRWWCQSNWRIECVLWDPFWDFN